MSKLIYFDLSHREHTLNYKLFLQFKSEDKYQVAETYKIEAIKFFKFSEL